MWCISTCKPVFFYQVRKVVTKTKTPHGDPKLLRQGPERPAGPLASIGDASWRRSQPQSNAARPSSRSVPLNLSIRTRASAVYNRRVLSPRSRHADLGRGGHAVLSSVISSRPGLRPRRVADWAGGNVQDSGGSEGPSRTAMGPLGARWCHPPREQSCLQLSTATLTLCLNSSTPVPLTSWERHWKKLQCFCLGKYLEFLGTGLWGCSTEVEISENTEIFCGFCNKNAGKSHDFI